MMCYRNVRSYLWKIRISWFFSSRIYRLIFMIYGYKCNIVYFVRISLILRLLHLEIRDFCVVLCFLYVCFISFFIWLALARKKKTETKQYKKAWRTFINSLVSLLFFFPILMIYYWYDTESSPIRPIA